MSREPNSQQINNIPIGANMHSGQMKRNQIVVMNGGQGMFFAVGLAQTLKEKYRIASKTMGKRIGPYRQPIQEAGLSNSTKNHAEFIQPPFLIDRHAVFFLDSHPQTCKNSEQAKQAALSLSGDKDTAVYLHLAGKYFLVDGHKFGCAFLAYDQDPEIHHAKALIFTEEEKEEQMSRLAGIAKKQAWRASLTQKGEVVIQTVQKHLSRRHQETHP